MQRHNILFSKKLFSLLKNSLKLLNKFFFAFFFCYNCKPSHTQSLSVQFILWWLTTIMWGGRREGKKANLIQDSLIAQ